MKQIFHLNKTAVFTVTTVTEMMFQVKQTSRLRYVKVNKIREK